MDFKVVFPELESLADELNDSAKAMSDITSAFDMAKYALLNEFESDMTEEIKRELEEIQKMGGDMYLALKDHEKCIENINDEYRFTERMLTNDLSKFHTKLFNEYAGKNHMTDGYTGAVSDSTESGGKISVAVFLAASPFLPDVPYSGLYGGKEKKLYDIRQNKGINVPGKSSKTPKKNNDMLKFAFDSFVGKSFGGEMFKGGISAAVMLIAGINGFFKFDEKYIKGADTNDLPDAINAGGSYGGTNLASGSSISLNGELNSLWEMIGNALCENYINIMAWQPWVLMDFVINNCFYVGEMTNYTRLSDAIFYGSSGMTVYAEKASAEIEADEDKREQKNMKEVDNTEENKVTVEETQNAEVGFGKNEESMDKKTSDGIFVNENTESESSESLAMGSGSATSKLATAYNETEKKFDGFDKRVSTDGDNNNFVHTNETFNDAMALENEKSSTKLQSSNGLDMLATESMAVDAFETKGQAAGMNSSNIITDNDALAIGRGVSKRENGDIVEADIDTDVNFAEKGLDVSGKDRSVYKKTVTNNAGVYRSVIGVGKTVSVENRAINKAVVGGAATGTAGVLGTVLMNGLKGNFTKKTAAELAGVMNYVNIFDMVGKAERCNIGWLAELKSVIDAAL